MSDPLLASSQAVLGAEGTVLHYGSAPGELAVCLREIGLAQRPECRTLSITGSSRGIDLATLRLADSRIAVGGVVEVGDCWWSRPEADQIVAICSHHTRERMRRVLRDHTRQSMDLQVDETDPFAVITLLGPRLVEFLIQAKVYRHVGDQRTTAPCVIAPVRGVPVVWILESDLRATACIPRGGRTAVLHELQALGQPLNLAWIGHQALEQFGLVQRRLHASPLIL